MSGSWIGQWHPSHHNHSRQSNKCDHPYAKYQHHDFQTNMFASRVLSTLDSSIKLQLASCWWQTRRISSFFLLLLVLCDAHQPIIELVKWGKSLIPFFSFFNKYVLTEGRLVLYVHNSCIRAFRLSGELWAGHGHRILYQHCQNQATKWYSYLHYQIF